MRGVPLGLAALLLAGAAATGCSHDAPPAPKTLAEGTRVVGAVTAALTGPRVSVMLPSGQANFVVTKPTARVDAARADGSHDLVAASGSELVGIAWDLDLGVYPDYVNGVIAAPSDVMGRPKQVRVTLHAGDVSVDIPVGDMIATSEKPATPSWVAVPRGAPLRLAVTYDGLTQTADPSTGTVDAGPAKAFDRGLPWLHSGDYAVGYPYVKGGGWAGGGRTWIVVEGAAKGSTLDGARGVSFHSSDEMTAVTAFLVKPQDRMLLRWTTKSGRAEHRTIDGTVSW